jgi:DNA primase large subunit
MEAGLDFAVKYPFSEAARKFLEGLDLNERIIELGRQRIKKAVKGEASARMLVHESDKKDDIASLAAARMILSHLRNNFLTNRFAVNESKIARGYLDREDAETVDRVASHFGINATKEGNMLLIDLPTYLKFALRDPNYRLINRKLFSGMVEITEEQKKRLVENAIKKHYENLPLIKDPPDAIKEAGKKLMEEMPKSETKITVKFGDHPPCIARILDEAKKHENLPHHARWYLATYLLSIGTSEDDITKIYADLPDYNEKVTRYQVDHIKKKGYNVPSCATVMTYGLCCAVCRIGHPLNWHNLSEERKGSIRRSGQ